MTFLFDQINPPPLRIEDSEGIYRFNNDVFNALQSLSFMTNPSVIQNADFSVLSGQGQTPTTQADGDNFNFIGSWYIVGATAATYSIKATSYPTGSIANGSASTIQSASPYYLNVNVTSFNGSPFYFYQRQANTVRKYQNQNMTYGLVFNNYNSRAIQVRTDIYSYYDTGNTLSSGSAIYIQPGITVISSSLITPSLAGQSIGVSPYSEFRFSFLDIPGGSANIDIYQIKCEIGLVSTLL